MKPLSLLALVSLSMTHISHVAAADASLTEAQKESIIKRLDQLLNRREAGATSGSSVAMSRLKSATASDSAAVALYMECVKRERFERAEKKGGEYTDWKQSHSDAFRTDAVGMCLRANAMGLASALQINTADKAKPEDKESAFLKTLPNFHSFLDLASTGVAQTAALLEDKKINHHGRISSQANTIKNLNLFSSVIADALNITAYITIPSKFPAKLDEALDATESFILPRLYAFGKLPPIDQAWDRHIKRLADGVIFYKKEKLIVKSKDLFEKALPLARWAQARDRFRYGTDKVVGATAMLDVIKAHLDHEFCVTWIEEFKELVKEDAPETSETAPQ